MPLLLTAISSPKFPSLASAHRLVAANSFSFPLCKLSHLLHDTLLLLRLARKQNLCTTPNVKGGTLRSKRGEWSLSTLSRDENGRSSSQACSACECQRLDCLLFSKQVMCFAQTEMHCLRDRWPPALNISRWVCQIPMCKQYNGFPRGLSNDIRC